MLPPTLPPRHSLKHTIRQAVSRRWDISNKEATPDAVSRAVNLAAGGQKAKYGALQAGWMPATPDEQARRKLSHTPPSPGLLFWQGLQAPACRKPAALWLPGAGCLAPPAELCAAAGA